MHMIWEKLKKWFKGIEEKITQWVEENEKELDFLGSYILGFNGGYLMKWYDEWFYPNTWFARAFNKYYYSEPLRLTDNRSGGPLEPVRTRIVWSYDDDSEKYYPFINNRESCVFVPNEWKFKKRAVL